MNCIACHKQILVNSAYWICKECKCSAHRKCRGDVHTSCDGVMTTYEQPPQKEANMPSAPDSSDSEFDGNFVQGYHGDLLFGSDDNDIPNEINCAYEMSDNIILFGKFKKMKIIFKKFI